jgi:hypothetical protein
MHALKMWRNYLLGRSFFLMKDHYGMTYLFDQPHLNIIQVICMTLIKEFYFEIKDIKGKENRVEDTLS